MPDDLYNSLVDWSAAFYRRSLEDLMHFAHDTGLSMTQISILFHLYYHGPCEISRLVKLMQVTKAATSQMVERMVQQDLVHRDNIPGDRRARLVNLTEKGRQIVDDCNAARQLWIKGLAEALSPEHRSTTIHALRTLTDTARQFDKKPS